LDCNGSVFQLFLFFSEVKFRRYFNNYLNDEKNYKSLNYMKKVIENTFQYYERITILGWVGFRLFYKNNLVMWYIGLTQYRAYLFSFCFTTLPSALTYIIKYIVNLN
jgi:hypothetical protein